MILTENLHAHWKAGKGRYKKILDADKIKFKLELGPELDKVDKMVSAAFKAAGGAHDEAIAKVKAQARKCVDICKDYSTVLDGVKDATARGGLKNRLKNISETLGEKYIESMEDYRQKLLERAQLRPPK